MKYADLHLHTEYSDGTFSPQEVVAKAKAAGLDCIAVTDHDTVQAIDLVNEEAELRGIENIPGIEITSDEDGMEFHILGYFIDYHNTDFLNLLRKIELARRERVYAIVKKLNEHKIYINAEDVFGISQKGTVSRLHIARIMLKEGYIRSASEAFQKYIGVNCPCYVGRFRQSPKDSIETILKVGGLPVLAHPHNIISDEWFLKLVNFGLRGVEAYYLEYQKWVTQKYLDLALKYNLLVTGGSDCHGEAKEFERIGSIKIPYELVERMKDEKSRK